MKIAYVTIEFPPYINGGLGRYADYAVNRLVHHGHRLSVITYNPGNLDYKTEKENLVIFRPRSQINTKAQTHIKWRWLQNIFKIYKYIHHNWNAFFIIKKLHKEEKLNIVAVHDWMSSITGIFCTLFLRIPVVFHIHNTEITMTPWGGRSDPFKLIKMSERIMGKLAKKIIVPTEKMKEMLTTHGWDHNKIKVIHHGYDSQIISLLQAADSDLRHSIKKTRKHLEEQFNIHSNQPLLLYVGRIAYAKGIFSLVVSMKYILEKYPHAKLVIIGEGDNYKLHSLIKKHHLEKSVYAFYRFLNFKDVIAYYSLADICVFPSLYEPFGLVALEAMSLGKPVILGEGFSRIFGGNVRTPTALFTRGDDPIDISRQVNYLLKDEKSAQKMGENAENFVKNNFSWDNCINDTVSFYGEACSKN